MNLARHQNHKPAALGQHVIAEFYGASQLLDAAPAEPILRAAALSVGATVLDIKLHNFGDHVGFTGVALLAESHISIHTWPEHDYAAIDIFMCGDVDPLKSLEALRAYFNPARENVQLLRRGEGLGIAAATAPPEFAR
ncbi:MAG: adenosylmethionine decarboxylase [Paracoccaceae bacterium]